MKIEQGFDAIHIGIIMIDSQGIITACNAVAEEMLDIKSNVVLGQVITDVFPETDLLETIKTGKTELRKKITINDKTYISSRKPVHKAGKVIGAVASFQDISQLETLAHELETVKKINEELEAIFNSSYDEIYVTDGEGLTVRVNKACESYYNVKAEEIVGKHVAELEKKGLFSRSIALDVIKEKRRITSTQTTKSGKKLIVTGNPLIDEQGGITRVVMNSRDITELTNLRQRLEDTEKLITSYRSEIAQLRKERLTTNEIIARSPQMQEILEMVEKVAQVDSTILLEGESGVGKGIIASKIHQLSKRNNGPFIVINCGAIPENLLESELFGYDAGAFTGAKKEGKKGLIELAQGGTVFLDEVTEIPLNLQVKLLHVIQEKKLMRVGSNKYVDVDIRIIAASNRNIHELVREKKFREDLFYRLNVVPLMLPPLRHRNEDIEPLVLHFLDMFSDKYEINKRITPEAMEFLTSYNWPGNVRELENLVERLVVTSDSPVIDNNHLPDYVVNCQGIRSGVFVLDVCSLKEATEEVERQLIQKAYEKYRNTYHMAEVLQVNQSTVVRKMQKYMAIKKETKDQERTLSKS